MKISPKRLGVAIALSQIVTAVPAFAQLEEIIVTAERREASLQETDISITAFSEATLNELGVSNYLDLADFAPNVMMHEMTGKSGGAIAIRGFKNAETIASFEPKVGLYLDGVILAKGSGSVFDILDLERVEILRGPQGTLYGRNSAGGAVNFITKKPTYELGGKLKATVGNYGRRDLKGTLNLPLIDDKLALKATVASIKRDGFWENRDNDPNDGIYIEERSQGEKDRRVAHVQLQWEPTDKLNVLYAYDMTDIDENQYPTQLVNYGASQPGLAQYVVDGSQRTISFNEPSFQTADVEGHSLTVNWEINDQLSLVSISALRNFDVENYQDSDSSPLSILINHSGDEVETMTQEVRLVGNLMDDKLEFVVGGFYMDENLKDLFTESGIYLYGIWSRTNMHGQNDIWALFGETTYNITDKLDITVGARYTEEDKTFNRSSLIAPINTSNYVTTLVFPEAHKKFDNFSASLGMSYQWTPDIMTYAKVSEGYVSGGFNPRSPTADLSLFTEGYDEETLVNYEIGWKTTLLDNRLQMNGAIFYTDYSDLQVNQLTETAQNNIDNAGDAEIKGLELEVTAVVTDSLQVGAGYGYLDPEYKTYINSQGQDLSNNHWAHAPKNTFNAYARYMVPDAVANADLIFRVDYSWVDDHFLLTANDPGLVDGNVAPSYDFINARMSLDGMEGPGGSLINLSLWCKNLTDELWYTSGYDLSAGFLGFVGKAAAPPRTFGIDLEIDL